MIWIVDKFNMVSGLNFRKNKITCTQQMQSRENITMDMLVILYYSFLSITWLSYNLCKKLIWTYQNSIFWSEIYGELFRNVFISCNCWIFLLVSHTMIKIASQFFRTGFCFTTEIQYSYCVECTRRHPNWIAESLRSNTVATSIDMG